MFIPNIFKDNICYISGFHRSGKSLLSALLPSFEKTEIINKDPLLYIISSMNENGELSFKNSKYLISLILSNTNYSNFIGRKINLKKTDETSIYKLINYKKHLNKISSKNKIKLDYSKNKNIIFFDVHNISSNLELWSKINKNFKLINIERNPIELAYSWLINGFGKHQASTISQILLYEHKKKYIPFTAYMWKKKYYTMEKIDRIIHELYFLHLKLNKKFNKFSNKNNIMRIKYENFLKHPLLHLKKINKFLGLKSRIHFKKYKSKINLKKLSNNDMIGKKLQFMKKNSSKESFKKLVTLNKLYKQI